jgi:BASS family bile acid:Na+ symporter
MLSFRDGLLLIATLASILAGIVWPACGTPFQPYPIYCMMVILFFSFLPIRLGAILSSVRSSVLYLGYCVFIKLILLPLLIFVSFRYMFPKYAAAALLLSGISSGVASPFFAGLLDANISLVFAMVVASSILVPFTLPALAHIFAGKYMEISLFAMSGLLGLVIFCPLILAEVLKRFAPGFTAKLSKGQYSVSLVSFVITNLGVFSRYAPFLREEPSTVLISLGVSVVLAVVYFVAGMLFSLGRPLPDHLSSIISFGIINNVLVLVLSSEFFSPIEATVAAMYTIPFFGLIVPLRLYRNWAQRRVLPDLF